MKGITITFTCLLFYNAIGFSSPLQSRQVKQDSTKTKPENKKAPVQTVQKVKRKEIRKNKRATDCSQINTWQ